MNFKRITISFFFLIVLLVNCTTEDKTGRDAFSITALLPESGPEGTRVEILGLGFSEDEADHVVKFNNVVAPVIDASETTLGVKVPIGATTGRVTVTKAGETIEGPIFTVTTPVVTKDFYVKFSVNGIIKIFEEGNPGYQSCGQCACSYVPALNDIRSASIVVCNNAPNWITAADIEGWNGDKLSVNSTNFPTAALEFTEDEVFYSSNNVSGQAGSEVNITSVVADGSFNAKKAFKVTGDFKCKVSQSDGTNVMDITEGTFVLRYTED